MLLGIPRPSGYWLASLWGKTAADSDAQPKSAALLEYAWLFTGFGGDADANQIATAAATLADRHHQPGFVYRSSRSAAIHEVAGGVPRRIEQTEIEGAWWSLASQRAEVALPSSYVVPTTLPPGYRETRWVKPGSNSEMMTMAGIGAYRYIEQGLGPAPWQNTPVEHISA